MSTLYVRAKFLGGYCRLKMGSKKKRKSTPVNFIEANSQRHKYRACRIDDTTHILSSRWMAKYYLNDRQIFVRNNITFKLNYTRTHTDTGWTNNSMQRIWISTYNKSPCGITFARLVCFFSALLLTLLWMRVCVCVCLCGDDAWNIHSFNHPSISITLSDIENVASAVLFVHSITIAYGKEHTRTHTFLAAIYNQKLIHSHRIEDIPMGKSKMRKGIRIKLIQSTFAPRNVNDMTTI